MFVLPYQQQAGAPSMGPTTRNDWRIPEPVYEASWRAGFVRPQAGPSGTLSTGSGHSLSSPNHHSVGTGVGRGRATGGYRTQLSHLRPRNTPVSAAAAAATLPSPPPPRPDTTELWVRCLCPTPVPCPASHWSAAHALYLPARPPGAFVTEDSFGA